MHGIGVIHITANLIGEACGEVEALVVGIDVDTTSVLSHGVAYYLAVLFGDGAVSVSIYKLDHTWEGHLTFWKVVKCGNTTRIVGHVATHVCHSRLQCPYAIAHVEVVNCIESIALVTIDGTHGLPFADDIVIVWAFHGRTPVGVGVSIDAFEHLFHVVLVVIIGGVDAQIEVLRTNNFIEDGQFDTFIGGLTNVLVLITVASAFGNGNAHQDIFGGIPINIEATTQFPVPETEVETEVTTDRGLPLQVWVSQHCTGREGHLAAAARPIYCGLPILFPKGSINIVVTGSTDRETKF